jgi:dTDP-4-amino-4,6-dideoxygalactose transaminase
VPVHLYGQMRDVAAWRNLCAEKGIELLEDCAQAHLAQLDGKVAGTFGRLGAYSFYPTKNLGAPGDAGAVITNDPALAKRGARLRNYGQSMRYHHPDLGMNSRLDEIQAAMLGVRLKWLERFTAKRRQIARSYFDEIHNPLVSLMSEPAEPAAHVYHLFVVTCPHRDALQAHLQSRDVQSLIHYPIPVHHQEPFRQIKRDPRGLTVSEEHAASCLSIPCHPQLSGNDVQAVIDAVNAFEID